MFWWLYLVYVYIGARKPQGAFPCDFLFECNKISPCKVLTCSYIIQKLVDSETNVNLWPNSLSSHTVESSINWHAPR